MALAPRPGEGGGFKQQAVCLKWHMWGQSQATRGGGGGGFSSGCSLEGGLAAQGLDDIAVSLVAPGCAMLHQAQHCLKVPIGRCGLHSGPGLGVADVGVGRRQQQGLHCIVVT